MDRLMSLKSSTRRSRSHEAVRELVDDPAHKTLMYRAAHAVIVRGEPLPVDVAVELLCEGYLPSYVERTLERYA